MSVLDPFDLIIGLDTEFVRITDTDNRIVSYQFALYNPRTGKGASGLITPDGPHHQHRYSLAGCLGRVLQAAERGGFIDTEDGRLLPKPRLLVAAHFSRADVCGFRDFPKLKRLFSVLRGTYATTERPAIFTVQTSRGEQRRVSVTLCDTQLIAPASHASLKALGELLGYPKLSIPDVVDERGVAIPAITRMDLAAVQHPGAFHAYAVRDAEIAVDWVVRFARFADAWGLPKLSPTIGSMAVAKLRSFAEQRLPSIIGKVVGKNGRLGKTYLPEALLIQGPVSDSFHGGRSECFRHGLHRALSLERPFQDIDLKGAYVTAMSPSRSVDWAGIEQCTDLDRLAVLGCMTFANVDFEFVNDTRFPSMPVYAGNKGLIYSLRGSTSVIGPELIVARDLGAKLTVRWGIIVPWLEDNPAEDELPFVNFARVINETRALYPKGSPEEMLSKTAGNSLYGKSAQSVGNMKPIPRGQTTFDSRDGNYKPVPPSSITCPLIAAYASGLPRAVLSEILSRLPDHVRVVSCTTDGWLSDCTEAEARTAASGPVARYFAKLRGLVDPSRSTEIFEVKHRAAAVLTTRSRHCVTVELAAPRGDRIDHAYMTARGSHHLDKEFDFDPESVASKVAASKAEAAELLRLCQERTYQTALERKVFVSPRDQWQSNADLTAKPRHVRVSLDYDYKREPVDVGESDGLLNFGTRPWLDLDAFHAARRDRDEWIEKTQSVLKTLLDWNSFQVWRGSPAMRMSGRRTPWQQAIIVAWARGLPGFPIRVGNIPKDTNPTLIEVAGILTQAGIPDVTRNVLMWMRRSAPDPLGTVDGLLEADHPVRLFLRSHLSDEALDSVLVAVPEQPFGEDVDELLEEPLRSGRSGPR